MNIKQQLVTPVWKWLLPLLLAAAGTIVYSNSFSGIFLFDDYSAIIRNIEVRHLFPFTLKWRCLVDYTFKLTYAVGGLNPAYYHAGNILIHVLAGLLLYGIMRRTLLLPSMSENYGTAAQWLAFFAAAIWLVHPLQTASVDYICQRYESMMGLFFFLTLYCFVRAADSQTRYPRLWSDIAILACLLGMGTKEVMAVAPVIIILYDYLFLAGSLREVFRVRWRIHLAMFCTLGVLFVLILKTMFEHAVGGSDMFTRMSSWTYMLTQAEVIVHYIWLAFIPYSLCFDYSWPPAENLKSVIIPALFLAGILLLTILFILRRNRAGFPLAWFFAILAPTSSIMPLGDMAFEHRMYLPLAGIIVLSVISFYHVLRRAGQGSLLMLRIGEYAGVVLALAVCILFGLLTYDRNTLYWSGEAIWRDVVEKRPQNIRALENFARELLRVEKAAEAERVLRMLLQRLDPVEGRGTSSYVIKPSILMHYQSAAHDRLGIALLCSDRTDEAISHFTEAIRIRRSDGYARHNLGLALLMSGKTNQALVELESVQAGDEGCERSQGLMALILSKQGEFARAVQCYRNAIEIDPSYLSAKCELAWLLATAPDDNVRNGKEALAIAREIASATLYASYHALDVLAAACAENGLFEEAIKHAVNARSIAVRNRQENGGNDVRTSGAYIKASDQDDVVRELEKRIKLYEQKMPYRLDR